MKLINFIIGMAFLPFNIFANSFTGIVQPINDVNLSFPISGLILKNHTKEGNLVKKGQALIKLDDSLATLEVKKRHLIYKDKSRLNGLKEEEKIVKSMLGVTKKLYSKNGAVSKDEVQSMKIKHASVVSSLNNLLENEKKEKVDYQIANRLLHQYLLKSSINGMITTIKYSKGEWVKQGEPIIRVIDTSECLINLNIKKEEISKFKLFSEVKISLNINDKNILKKGKIVFISPTADFASGLVLVKVKFDNKDYAILPGLEVKVQL